ncbi:hypothetical protein HDU81_002593 [Chytriomyces hyalinus]|nr:hypothetical protein HDU81_002593 [Chytriomyces hyalinus]
MDSSGANADLPLAPTNVPAAAAAVPSLGRRQRPLSWASNHTLSMDAHLELPPVDPALQSIRLGKHVSTKSSMDSMTTVVLDDCDSASLSFDIHSDKASLYHHTTQASNLDDGKDSWNLIHSAFDHRYVSKETSNQSSWTKTIRRMPAFARLSIIEPAIPKWRHSNPTIHSTQSTTTTTIEIDAETLSIKQKWDASFKRRSTSDTDSSSNSCGSEDSDDARSITSIELREISPAADTEGVSTWILESMTPIERDWTRFFRVNRDDDDAGTNRLSNFLQSMEKRRRSKSVGGSLSRGGMRNRTSVISNGSESTVNSWVAMKRSKSTAAVSSTLNMTRSFSSQSRFSVLSKADSVESRMVGLTLEDKACEETLAARFFSGATGPPVPEKDEIRKSVASVGLGGRVKSMAPQFKFSFKPKNLLEYSEDSVDADSEALMDQLSLSVSGRSKSMNLSAMLNRNNRTGDLKMPVMERIKSFSAKFGTPKQSTKSAGVSLAIETKEVGTLLEQVSKSHNFNVHQLINLLAQASIHKPHALLFEDPDIREPKFLYSKEMYEIIHSMSSLWFEVSSYPSFAPLSSSPLISPNSYSPVQFNFQFPSTGLSLPTSPTLSPTQSLSSTSPARVRSPVRRSHNNHHKSHHHHHYHRHHHHQSSHSNPTPRKARLNSTSTSFHISPTRNNSRRHSSSGKSPSPNRSPGVSPPPQQRRKSFRNLTDVSVLHLLAHPYARPLGNGSPPRSPVLDYELDGGVPMQRGRSSGAGTAVERG